MNQDAFDFSRLVPMDAPFQGSTPESRASSESGADCANETRSRNIETLRRLWKEPHTLHEMAFLAKLPLSSICSLKDAIKDELEWVGYQRIEWEGNRRSTKRSVWRIRS